VDILSTLYRVELAVGVAEQQAQALFQQAQLADNVKRRCGGAAAAAACSHAHPNLPACACMLMV